MVRILTAVGVALVGVVVWGVGEVAAADEIQNASQLYEVTARDITHTEVTVQNFTVFTNVEDMAQQRYKTTVYDPVAALGVIGPELMRMLPDGVEVVEPITVQVYSGTANGYTVVYSFDDSDLVCKVNNSGIIPSIGAAGALSGTMWGYNVVGSAGTVPAAWLPVPQVPTQLAVTAAPSASPYDEMYMAVGAKVGMTAMACRYENTLRVTLTGNP